MTATNKRELAKTNIPDEHLTFFIRYIILNRNNNSALLEELLDYFDQRHANKNAYYHSFWNINFGYSRTKKLDAVKDVLWALVWNKPLDIKKHGNVLRQGNLGKIVKNHELLKNLAKKTNSPQEARPK